MNETQKKQQFDLEERTYKFAVACRDFTQAVPKTPANTEYGRQFIRSSGSTAANYIEANEALSRKDFFHRIRICRKEAKESRLWLRLMIMGEDTILQTKRDELIQEAVELGRIFTAILQKDNEKGR